MNAFSNHHHVGTYARNECASVHGRAAEGRAFVKAARMLDDLLAAPFDTALRERAIAFNRVLWTAVQADATRGGGPLSDALKAKLVSLSLYVDRALWALRVSRDTAPIQSLIDINRAIAGGLLAAPMADEVAHP